MCVCTQYLYVHVFNILCTEILYPHVAVSLVFTTLFFMLGWSYFEISPGPVFHAVTFLITSEGCCASHGNEVLFVSSAEPLSATSCSTLATGGYR